MPTFKNIIFGELCAKKGCFLSDNCIKQDLYCSITAKDIRKILKDNRYIIIKRHRTQKYDIKTVIIKAKLIDERPLAWQVDDKKGKYSRATMPWLAKSQIKLEKPSIIGDTVNIEMPIWMARNNGLI